MCKTFNASQSDYEIVCVSQDNYDNNLQNTIAAFRANKQPTVTQIFDAGTLDLMLSNAYVPVEQLMKDNGYTIDWSNYFSGVGFWPDSPPVSTCCCNAAAPINPPMRVRASVCKTFSVQQTG